MRILHTSDWHLGKRLFKLDRTPEHEQFLNWLLGTLIEEKIDLLLIAGDIFDTPTPPHQSLEVFYNFLHRVSTETKTETMIIAGNHDSGLLLEAPAVTLMVNPAMVMAMDLLLTMTALAIRVGPDLSVHPLGTASMV
jgi:exonuclease SbcD